jgi:hypothetical protein
MSNNEQPPNEDVIPEQDVPFWEIVKNKLDTIDEQDLKKITMLSAIPVIIIFGILSIVRMFR